MHCLQCRCFSFFLSSMTLSILVHARVSVYSILVHVRVSVYSILYEFYFLCNIIILFHQNKGKCIPRADTAVESELTCLTTEVRKPVLFIATALPQALPRNWLQLLGIHYMRQGQTQNLQIISKILTLLRI